MTPRAARLSALIVAGLGSNSLFAAAADCTAYLAQAKQLHTEVKAVIGKALEERLDVSADGCKFRSEEWSVRDEKHQAWCAGKDSTAIDQRLDKMSAELRACGADLSAKRQTNGGPSERVSARAVFAFDQLPVGALPSDAFQSVGMDIVAAYGAPAVYGPEQNMVFPAGRRHVLLVAGDRTTSLTMVFDEPIRRFGLTRIGTAGGASVPTWKLEAFDRADNMLGATGEEHGLPSAPQEFSIAADGIVRVVLSTDNRWGEGTWATWNSLPVVELAFEH